MARKLKFDDLFNDSSETADEKRIRESREYWKQTASNIPGSVAQLGRDIVYPIAHPIETAKSLLDLGSGVVQLAIPGEQPNEAVAKAVGEYFADRYGSMDSFKQSFKDDPVGVLADVSAVLTGGGFLGIKGSAALGSTSQIGQAAQSAGRLLDPITPVTATATAIPRAISSVGPAAFGKLSGTSPETVRAALAASREGGLAKQTFLDNLRGNVSEAEIVPRARGALDQIATDLTDYYKSGTSEVLSSTAKVDFDEIAKITKDIEKANAVGTGGTATTLTAQGQRKLKVIEKIIEEFRKDPSTHNMAGLDAMKKRIDNEYPTGVNPDKSAERVVATARKAVNDILIELDPKYAEVMQAYQRGIEMQKGLEKDLALGPRKSTAAALSKLSSTLKEGPGREVALDQLRTLNPDLIPALAGQQLSRIAPAALAGVAGPMAIGLSAGEILQKGVEAGKKIGGLSAFLTATSPKFVGEASNIIGTTQRLMNPITRNYAPIARASRLAGSIEEEIANERERERLLNQAQQLLSQ